jgi:hypothetical protein
MVLNAKAILILMCLLTQKQPSELLVEQVVVSVNSHHLLEGHFLTMS